MAFITNGKHNKSLMASRKKLTTITCLGVTMLLLPLLLFYCDPVLIIARYRSRIANGSAVHELLKKEQVGVHISSYLFNITNAERFHSGEDHKLKVEEVGPFTYKEVRRHEDLELDLEGGVVRYSPRLSTVFLPEASVADPRSVRITMPNIAMLSMSSMIGSHNYLSQLGYNLLTLQLESKSVVTMDAHNYLWGYEEPLITTGKTFLPGWISFDKMGLMDRLYDKKVHYRLEVGATDADKFSVKSLNGFNGLEMWGYDDPDQRTRCNTFTDAYEGFFYHTELTSDSRIRIFRNVLCRMLELDFHGTRTLDYGAEALVFKLSNRTYFNNPDKECTCKGICIDGISDLSPCFYDLPLAMSNAHFFNADPKLYDRIEGLSPNENDHGSEFLIEPKIGMSLATSFSIQVNIVVRDVSYNAEASPYSGMVLPIGYFKIVQPELSAHKKADLRQLYITGPYIVLAIEIAMLITGLWLLVHSARLLYWNWICSKTNGIEFQLPEVKKPTVLSVDALADKDEYGLS